MRSVNKVLKIPNKSGSSRTLCASGSRNARTKLGPVVFGEQKSNSGSGARAAVQPPPLKKKLAGKQISSGPQWIDLEVAPEELRIENTLAIGQSFAWTQLATLSSSNRYVGVVQGCAFLLEGTPTTTIAKVLSKNDVLEATAIQNLKNYLRLEVKVAELYKKWSNKCPWFAKVAPSLPGVRIMRQPVFETLLSFVISQNNNVSRITKLRQKLGEVFGVKVQIHPEFEDTLPDLYTFPTLEQMLAKKPSEQDFRDMGMGYRARYIFCILATLETAGKQEKAQKAKKSSLKTKTPELTFAVASLEELATLQDTKKVVDCLMTLMGIGRKVADCIALFSCNCLELVPVDTHVWKIAKREYGIKEPNLTPKVYDKILKKFYERFGDKCGWAHTVLFAAELRKMKKDIDGESPTPMKAMKHAVRASTEASNSSKKGVAAKRTVVIQKKVAAVTKKVLKTK